MVPRGNKKKMLKLDNEKCALFLHLAGEKAIEVYNALTFTEGPQI